MTSRSGAYGLAVSGLPSTSRLLSPCPAHWPPWHIDWRADTPAPETDSFNDDRTSLALGGGWGRVHIERSSRRTLVTSPTMPSGEALVHPVLSVSALMAARWDGAEPFHGGVFVQGGRAWITLGAREAGKSTTLAVLHRRKVAVAADDLAIVRLGPDGFRVLTGPRCLDLRQGAAERFGMGAFIGYVGNRDRWRVELPPLAGDHPLGGFLWLGWSDAVGLESLPAATRLSLLTRAYAAVGMVSTSPMRVLELATFPALHWTRPRSLPDAEQAVDVLLAGLDALDARR